MFSTISVRKLNKICKNTRFFLNGFTSPNPSIISSHFSTKSSTKVPEGKIENTDYNSGNEDQKFEWRQRLVGAQPAQNLKVGPYKRGRWFVSYKEDPGSFITNVLIILVTGYAIFTLLPGESMKVRRQRKLLQMLLEKANMTESELNYIENYKLESDKEEVN